MYTKKHITLFLVLLLTLSGKIIASDGLKIQINAPQWSSKTLKLVSYYNGAKYTQDTVRLSSKGAGAFESNHKYPEGLYIVYLDSVRFFDILLADDQVFKLSIDTTDFIRKNKIEGSVQSEAFAEYPRYLADKQRERSALLKELNTLKTQNKNTDEVVAQMDSLNKQVNTFQEAFYKKYDGLWVARFFKGFAPIETGPYPAPRNLDQAYLQCQYLKSHYFDNIDLQDPRFWYTNFFPERIDQYMNNIVEPAPDSLARAASWLVSKTLGDTICSRMMLGKLMNYALSSEMMGMENVWARLAEDYYFKGLAYTPDSAFLARLKSEYRNIHYNRIGMKARDLMLQDSTGTKFQLYDLPGELTLVYFFEPDCGFCKKITPRIHQEIYEKYKDKGLSVACICITKDRQEWLKYVNDQHLNDWYNLWDPERISYFWQYYDTSTTPAIYLVNKDHEIIAKKLDVESLDRYLSRYFQK